MRALLAVSSLRGLWRIPVPAAAKDPCEPLLARWYYAAKAFWVLSSRRLTVLGERFVRFLAIPYVMATRIDWGECKKHPFLVFLDHLDIFFRLGYFPDNYGECRLWEKDRAEWKYYWGSGYDPYVMSLLHRKVQRKDCDVLFEDKEICYQLCLSYGLPLPRQYGALDPGDDLPEAIRDLFDRHGARKLLLKPVNSAGGKGIWLVECVEGQLLARCIHEVERAIPLDKIVLETRCVVQEKVVQHALLNSISAYSLNTTRIATLMKPDHEVLVVGTYLRFGRGTSFVDNACSGGLGVAIDPEKGRLGNRANDEYGRLYPLSSLVPAARHGLVVPFWQEQVALARRVQHHFAPFNRFLGMDIGVSQSGPVLIEVNSRYDNTGIESCCGPILRNDDVRRAFLDYGIISHRLLQPPP